MLQCHGKAFWESFQLDVALVQWIATVQGRNGGENAPAAAGASGDVGQNAPLSASAVQAGLESVIAVGSGATPTAAKVVVHQETAV